MTSPPPEDITYEQAYANAQESAKAAQLEATKSVLVSAFAIFAGVVMVVALMYAMGGSARNLMGGTVLSEGQRVWFASVLVIETVLLATYVFFLLPRFCRRFGDDLRYRSAWVQMRVALRLTHEQTLARRNPEETPDE